MRPAPDRPTLRLDLAHLTPKQAEVRVRRLCAAILHAAGLSQRQIAFGMGLPRTTVEDDLAACRSEAAAVSVRLANSSAADAATACVRRTAGFRQTGGDG